MNCGMAKSLAQARACKPVPHFADVLDHLGIILGPINFKNTVFFAKKGPIIYVTMPIAIVTDQNPLSYSTIIGWRHRVFGRFVGLTIVQFNHAIHKLTARLPLIVKYRGIHWGM